MVDVTQTAPIGTALPSGASGHGGTKDRQGSRGKARPNWKSAVDVAQVMGIPENELTPKVQAALDAIITEYERLRDELDHSVAHAAYLQDLADAHPFLPVINRRALLREVTRVASRAEKTETTHTFIYIHIPVIEDIRIRHGHAAAETALIQAAVCLSHTLRASDIIGSLGGGDFGIVLTLARREVAQAKVPHLIDAVREQGFTWRDENITLDVAVGMHQFEPGQGVEAIMDAADRDLIEGNLIQSPMPVVE